EASATTSAAPTTPPTAPSGLIATAVSASQIRLNWTDESTNEESFVISRSATSGGTYTQIATVLAGVEVYTDTGRAANSTWYYQVCAKNSVGNSDSSNEAFATTPDAPPTAPSTLVATAISPTRIDLTWADNSSNETGFKIQRSTTSASSGFTEIYTPGAGIEAQQDNSVGSATTYWYKVCATNAGGDSAYTTAATATTPAEPVYSISGSVSGGTTGRIYIEVNGEYNRGYGTSIAAAGAYEVRGLTGGGATYTLTAWQDTIGQGVPNASNCTGTYSSTVTIVAANATGINITLNTPAAVTPVAPQGVVVGPLNGSAMVFLDTPKDPNDNEIASSYKIYWKVGSPPTTSVYDGVLPVVANDNDVAFVSGLTDGNTVYFAVTALVGATESALSPPTPALIGAPTGGYSVSGTVSYSGSLTGPLYVGVYLEGEGGEEGPPVITCTRIASPATNGQTFTITGVPNGTYGLFAICDMNSNGAWDIGDVSNVENEGVQITVTTANLTGKNQTLSLANAIANVTTDHYKDSPLTYEGYNVDMEVYNGRKLVVAVNVTGPGLNGITDLRKSEWEGFNYYLNRETSPTVGDTYTFNVTYSDGTPGTLTDSVSGVLNSFVASMSVDSTIPSVPIFSWTAPSSPPASYTYSLYINGPGAWWYYPDSGTGMPSSQLSVVYNFDDNAEPSALPSGTYNWNIRVEDANGNSATLQKEYIVP
ncbi:MAG: fibronectin type III domain-containing protein, partial [Planctomycetota bacterium]